MIGLEEVASGQHLCTLYFSDRERLELAHSFLKSALEKGETCCIISDRRTSEAILSGIRRLSPELSGTIKSRIIRVSFARLISKIRVRGAENAASDWREYIGNISPESAKNIHILSLPNKTVLFDKAWQAYESMLDSATNNNLAAVCCLYSANVSHIDNLWANLCMHKNILSGGWVCRNPNYLFGDGAYLSEENMCIQLLDNTHIVALEYEVTRDCLTKALRTKNDLREELAHTRMKLEKAVSIGFHFVEPLLNIKNSTDALRSLMDTDIRTDMYLQSISSSVNKLEKCLREIVESGPGRWVGNDDTSFALNAQDVEIRRAA